ncbi:hypothetical protein BHE74_00029311 [Ensete ventricosum]|nr:hypothetical protein GW17_00002603 [Ensete ventricosum]RWW63506.1 hypothetical protein BHE74_00029311 [Ensete ventricosum]
MQAPKEAPPDMQLKDKFLVQSTVVPYGTTEEDIVPSFFSKENGRYIQENKLRVILVSPPHSPALEPINGALMQEPANEIPDSAVTCIPIDGVSQQEPATEVPILRNISISDNVSVKQDPVQEITMSKDISIPNEQALSDVAEITPSHVGKDIDDLKLKLNNIEAKLNEVS